MSEPVPVPPDPGDFVVVPVPIPWYRELERQASAVNTTPEHFIRDIVEDHVMKPEIEIPSLPVAGVPETIDAKYVALLSFASAVPFEVCIKMARGERIVYIWANKLFLKMAGLEEMGEILNKTVAEVWRHDSQRVELIDELDREVLEKRQTIIHFVEQSTQVLRPRIRIIFPLGDKKDLPFLGTIGMDLEDKEAALKFCAQIKPGGDWRPHFQRKKPR